MGKIHAKMGDTYDDTRKGCVEAHTALIVEATEPDRSVPTRAN